ncbi:uncharacterized protein LOC132759061 [Ruditapes philippinarum]|uniref:uncharacterized protein LOC132759061 n=1 Tax=Ruditapes philippinarum TaxID=129788 RepID=UPI00295BEFC9|nr:uncharacterized protein LOC132759061 [Ruditapes philippinarum]
MIPKSIPASPETAHSLAASRYKRDQMNYSQKRNKSINKKEVVSRNNCDIIRNPLEVKNADTVKLEDNEGSNLCQSNNSSFQGSFLQDYVKHWSDDPFVLNTCFESYPDGSEFAGHEFESLNFNRDYTRSPSGDLHFQPIFPGEEIQDSNMAEMVVTETFPGMYEHVTKMGRVGKNHRDLHSAGPQFRKLPFQDQTFPMTQTSTPVSTPTPRKSEPVIIKFDEEDDLFKFPEIATSQRSRPQADITPFVSKRLWILVTYLLLCDDPRENVCVKIFCPPQLFQIEVGKLSNAGGKTDKYQPIAMT